MIEPRSSFVDANTIRLHYLEWNSVQLFNPTSEATSASIGSDEVPIVMLHGLGATADIWRLTAPRLCQHRLVVAFDQRGHGQSEKPESGYDLTTIAEDAVSGMAALGMGKVALVGHGWGARVALVLAAHHPALVSSLILVDCPHVEPRHWPGMTRERFIREMDPKELYASRAAFIEARRQEMSDFWSSEVEAILLSAVQELPDGRVEELLHADRQRQIRESLWEDRALSYYGKLICPVLLVPAADAPQPDEELPEQLVHSDEFAAAKGYMAAQVARIIQHCSVLWIPRTHHDIQLHRPEVLAQAIAQFIQE